MASPGTPRSKERSISPARKSSLRGNPATTIVHQGTIVDHARDGFPRPFSVEPQYFLCIARGFHPRGNILKICLRTGSQIKESLRRFNPGHPRRHFRMALSPDQRVNETCFRQLKCQQARTHRCCRLARRHQGPCLLPIVSPVYLPTLYRRFREGEWCDS